jgi:hypothetical protein
MRRIGRRPVAVGVALGADTLVAVVEGRARGDDGVAGAFRSRPLDPPESGGWPDLAVAFAELAESVGEGGGHVNVALLPPLVEVRHIALPALREEELRHVLARDAARYFPGAREPQVIGFELAPGLGRRTAPLLTAAAPAWLVEAIYAAAERAGWGIGRIVPAHSAWVAGAILLAPELRRGAGVLAVLGANRVEVLRLEHGRLEGCRRLPTYEDPERLSGALADVITASNGSGTKDAALPRTARPTALVGTRELRAAVSDRLAAAKQVLIDTSRAEPLFDSPPAIAARFARHVGGPDLLPERVYAAARRRARRIVALLTATALLVLAGAVALERWGVERELAAVGAGRVEIRDAVGEAIRVREVIAALDERLAALAALETTSPRWSEVIAIVGESLPKEAHLVSFRAQGDTLFLEGVAPHAATVFEALQRSPWIAAVRASAPIQREIRQGQPPVERFVAAALLLPPLGIASAGGVER